MDSKSGTHRNRRIHYDSQRRRLWINGQRIHHGLTGTLLAVTGALLMVHDWKDHSFWFERGPGSQL